MQLTGQKWAVIAALLPGRTDDAVRNRYLRLQKKKSGTGAEEEEVPAASIVTNQDLRDCESVKKGDMWTEEEDRLIMEAVMRYGQKWQVDLAPPVPHCLLESDALSSLHLPMQAISERVPGRSANAVRNRFLRCCTNSSGQSEPSYHGSSPCATGAYTVAADASQQPRG